MSDPLAPWFVHQVTVRRWTGDDAYGDEFDAAHTVTGYYSDKTEFSAGQVIAAGRFAFPLDVAYIPVQSEIDLPAAFGGRTVRVVSVSVGDAGNRPVPKHQVVGVL